MLNSRALTIYLWHLPVVIAVGVVGAELGLGWRLPAVVALVAVAVTLFGWVKDVAARRRPALLPGRRARLAATSALPGNRPTAVARSAR
jgi:peptidoglycan/LPS O-acetylase OafA/YrhL